MRAESYFKEKKAKYQSELSKLRRRRNNSNVNYRPFILETNGVVHKDAKKIMRRFAFKIAQRSDEIQLFVMGRLMTLLAAKLQKGNARAILNHYDLLN